MAIAPACWRTVWQALLMQEVIHVVYFTGQPSGGDLYYVKLKPTERDVRSRFEEQHRRSALAMAQCAARK